jgi:hypothetical protein
LRCTLGKKERELNNKGNRVKKVKRCDNIGDSRSECGRKGSRGSEDRRESRKEEFTM